MEYRKKVITGVAWSAGEKFATSAVRIAIGVFILRYLTPEDFGVVQMLAAFSMIAATIIDSGFSQALIRKKNATDRDYNSIFYLNIVIALSLYVILIGLSYPLARFFRQPELTSYAPILFLALPLTALGLIQTTILSRAMNFRSLSKISFAATVVSSVVVIILAASGFGPWALIWQTVSTEVVKTLFLWIISRWRPGLGFSMESVRGLYSFGSRLFLSGIISQVFNQVTTVIIGRMSNPAQVGLYYQPLKIKDSVTTALSYSAQNVSYPALASFQDDETKLRTASRQVVHMLSFILFPVMAGLILVVPEALTLIATEKWIPAIPYFQIFCVSGFFLPLASASMNMLKAKGEGNTILKSEVIKKLFALVAITVAAFHSVVALAWAYTLWMAFEMCVNSYFGKNKNGYTYRMQFADTLPYLIMTAVMFVCVVATVWFTGLSSMWISLGVKIAVGVAVYIVLAAIIRPPAWKESLAILRSVYAPPGS